MKKEDRFRSTKLEKTGDHTFNIHTADGGHFECTSQKKLSGIKEINYAPSSLPVCHGLGDGTPLICDACKRRVTRIQGIIYKKKILHLCKNCKNIDYSTIDLKEQENDRN